MSLSIPSSDSSRYQAALDRYLQRFDRVEQGSDFFHNFDRCRDDGEKRRVFFETARRLDVPLRAIGELLTYKDQLLVTLALQSLSSIENEEIRHRLVYLELIEGVDPDPAEIYALPNPEEYQPWSALVLQKLCEQAESGSDLARLSAAWTIEQLNYSQAYTGKLLHQSAKKIHAEILQQNFQKLQDRYLSSNQADREQIIEFITFAPIPVLMKYFSLSCPPFLKDVLQRLGILGVEFIINGIEYLDTDIAKVSLQVAESIAHDSRYRDVATQTYLAQILINIFDDKRQELRDLAAHSLTNLVSNLDKDKAKTLILLKQWDEVATLGDVAIPALHEIINGQPTIDGPDCLIVSQLRAVKCLHQICSYEESKLIENLGILLLNPVDYVRYYAAILLRPLENKIDDYLNLLVTYFQLETPYLNKEPQKMSQQDFQAVISMCQTCKEEDPKIGSTVVSCFNRISRQDIAEMIQEASNIRVRAAESLQDTLINDLEKLKCFQGIVQNNIKTLDDVLQLMKETFKSEVQKFRYDLDKNEYDRIIKESSFYCYDDCESMFMALNEFADSISSRISQERQSLSDSKSDYDDTDFPHLVALGITVFVIIYGVFEIGPSSLLLSWLAGLIAGYTITYISVILDVALSVFLRVSIYKLIRKGIYMIFVSRVNRADKTLEKIEQYQRAYWKKDTLELKMESKLDETSQIMELLALWELNLQDIVEKMKPLG